MIITNKKQLKKYRQVCQLSTDILARLRDALKPGIYPIDIDNLAKKICRQHQVKPSFQEATHKGRSYDFATCISVNDTVVHGVPSSVQKLELGDIVKLDFGIIKDGFYTDQCVTVSLGQPSPAVEKLILTARKSVLAAVAKATPKHTIGDLGHTMHTIALQNGFDVLKQYTGHAIGKGLHEMPLIPAHGQPHTGDRLKKGMVLCIEDQLVTGSDQVYVDKDGWTVRMKDKGLTAMFEYMVVVRPIKPIILTPTLDWPIVV